jgi:hypothetical protein
MIDWKELDAAIMKAIDRDGIRTFTAIAHRVEEQARPHALRVAKNKNTSRPIPPWRIVDRRLQALRRLGYVEFSGKEWRMVSS